MERVHLNIQGVVQGVGFRHHTRMKASELGLTGYVKNLPDGTVEVIVEGETQEINQFLDWAHHGPSAAQVKQVDIHYEDANGEFSSFTIER